MFPTRLNLIFSNLNYSTKNTILASGALRTLFLVSLLICLPRIVFGNEEEIFSDFEPENIKTLDQALVVAYKTNPQFKSLQAEYKANVESFNLTLARHFLPDVYASIEESKIKQDSNGGQSLSQRKSGKSVTASQNIFEGGAGIMALKRAGKGAKIAKRAYLANEQKLILDHISIYLDYIVKKQALTSTNRSIAAMSEHLKVAKAKLELGEGTRTEVAEAKLNLAKTQTEGLSRQAGFEIASSHFQNYFGFKPKTLLLPKINTTQLPTSKEFLFEQAEQIDFSINNALENMEVSKLGFYIELSELLPKANVRASASKSESNGPGNQTNITNDKSATLSVVVPIFEKGGSRYSEIRKNKQLHRKAAYDLQATKNKFSIDLNKSWQEYVTSTKAIRTAHAAFRAASVRLNSVNEEVSAGLKILANALDAERDLLEAEIQQLSAKQQLILSTFKIRGHLNQLTAENLIPDAASFDPEAFFNQNKYKIFGF